MLKQYLRKRRKILRGWLRTRFGTWSHYDSSRYWDEEIFSSGVSDRAAVGPVHDETAVRWHYHSVWQIMQSRIDPLRPKRVFDLGTGAGIWLRMLERKAEVLGCDVSVKAVEHLRSKGHDVIHGRIVDALPAMGQADIICAIGVMFHIVDDDEWRNSIKAIGNALAPGGLLIVGGHFGWLDGVNVQFDPSGRVNKRLRSLGRWKRELLAAGFGKVEVVRNYAYMRVKATMPENNILFAEKL